MRSREARIRAPAAIPTDISNPERARRCHSGRNTYLASEFEVEEEDGAGVVDVEESGDGASVSVSGRTSCVQFRITMSTLKPLYGQSQHLARIPKALQILKMAIIAAPDNGAL